MLKAATILLALAAFARLGLAVPATEAKAHSYVYTNWTTGFDQETTNGSFDQQNADNVDRDLQFNMAVQPIHDAHESCYGVCASTFPADIGFNTSDKSASHTVTSAYPNSSVVSFALHSFDFGCDAPHPVEVQGSIEYELMPVNCSLHATGITRGGHVRTLDVNYVPQVTYPYPLYFPAAPMTTIMLPKGWEELDTVRFLVNTQIDASTPYDGTVYLDTFKYTVKNITTAA